ncbi:TRAP transporter small permease [Sagittula sp. S175]|uniref:TRAP transporter small permease n=1 Tax=Sagittula sp. S175 TaxID=3415129 RepID=UPI003C7DF43C
MTETSVATMTPVNATGPVWRLIEWAMLACFIGMLAVMFIQVTARYALAVGVPWTDETSRFLYIGQIFLGMSIAQRYGQHIRTTVALDLMGPRLRRLSETLAEIVTAGDRRGADRRRRADDAEKRQCQRQHPADPHVGDLRRAGARTRALYPAGREGCL